MHGYKSLMFVDQDKEWQGHGDPRVSQLEETQMCEDPNRNKVR